MNCCTMHCNVNHNTCRIRLRWAAFVEDFPEMAIPVYIRRLLLPQFHVFSMIAVNKVRRLLESVAEKAVQRL